MCSACVHAYKLTVILVLLLSATVAECAGSTWESSAAAQRKDELLLSEHFSEGLRTVRRALPGAPLRVINFDWHGAVKELREKGAVEGLWALLETLVSQVGRCTIFYSFLGDPLPPAKGVMPKGPRERHMQEDMLGLLSRWK